MLPKQNRSKPDIRDPFSGPRNSLISGLHCICTCIKIRTHYTYFEFENVVKKYEYEKEKRRKSLNTTIYSCNIFHLFNSHNNYLLFCIIIIIIIDTDKPPWDFDIQSDHLISASRPDLIIINKKQEKKKRICKIFDYTVSADHRINLKECEKKDKYLDLARELKKLWNMKVTIVPIVIGAFGTITKGLLKRLKD